MKVIINFILSFFYRGGGSSLMGVYYFKFIKLNSRIVNTKFFPIWRKLRDQSNILEVHDLFRIKKKKIKRWIIDLVIQMRDNFPRSLFHFFPFCAGIHCVALLWFHCWLCLSNDLVWYCVVRVWTLHMCNAKGCLNWLWSVVRWCSNIDS